MKRLRRADLKACSSRHPASDFGGLYRDFLIVILIAVAVTANLTTVDADESGQPLQVVDPYMLFFRLRHVWSATSYPNLVDYTITVTTSGGNVNQTLSYAGQLESATEDFRVHSISMEEAAHPYVPKGTNIIYSLHLGIRTGASGIGSDPNANGGIGLSGIINPEKPIERFAIPQISPIYSFGIRTCSSTSEMDDTQPSDLSIIGRATTASRRYRISVAGVESIAGQHTIHLALVALKDPHRNRLSDLWIVPTTNTLLRARITGNFVGPAESSVPWTIDFTKIDGYTYIQREAVDAPLHWGHHTFDQVQIPFENIRSDAGRRGAFFAIPSDYQGLNAISEPDEFFGQACDIQSKLVR